MVTKGICFPQFLHPTSGDNKWLNANIKWVHIDEKAYKKSNKRKKANWPPWYAPIFTFLHFMILMSFEFNKRLECSKSSMETIYYLLVWAIRASSIYYLCLLSLFFSFFIFLFLFFFLFPMPFNFCPPHPWRKFCHDHDLFPYLLPKSPDNVLKCILVTYLCGRYLLITMLNLYN